MLTELSFLSSLIFLFIASSLTALVGYFWSHHQQSKTIRAQQDELHNAALNQERVQLKATALEQEIERLRSEKHQQSQENIQRQQQLERLLQQKHDAEKTLEALSAREQGGQTRLEELKTEKKELQQQHSDLQARYEQINQAHTELKTSLEEKERSFSAQMQQLTHAKKELSQEFENLAHKVLEEKGKSFTQSNQSSLEHLLKPFREQIEAFQKRTNEVHDSSVRSQEQLGAEIKKVLETGLQMSSEAHNLTRALKGSAQQRGAWGEAQLERTLELSGLIAEDHYQAQTSFIDNEGKRKQTDYIVKLPDGKHLIIDSKVTLNAYDAAANADTQEALDSALKAHCLAVRKHIDDLRSKDYSTLANTRSPDFVLMFMPIEPAFIEALKFDKTLFEYGHNKGIILVSHTTLIPILRTVANLWMLDNSTKEARALSLQAGDIYNKVSRVAERINDLGKSLSAAGNHYNKTVTALVGQQGLVSSVNQFKQLANNVSNNLPELEHKSFDLNHERLELIIQHDDEHINEAPSS